MDGLGDFSLCAALLEIVRFCISECHRVRTAVGRTEVWCIPDQSESEELVSKRIELNQYLN